MRLLRLPWAKRHHTHPDPGLFKYEVCSKCGHLILTGHVENKKVSITDKHSCKPCTVERTAIYAKSCAPPYDHIEIAIDGITRFYKDGEEVKEGG